MIEVNAANYDLAHQHFLAGHWVADPLRGLLSRSGSLAGGLNSSGYLRVRFPHNGRSISVLAHRVMWRALNGPIPDGLFVNHLDGDKTNNAIANLEIVTHQQNINHAWATGLKATCAGENAAWTKLGDEQVRAICTRARRGENQGTIAAEFNISRGTVSEIKNGSKRADITADIPFGATHDYRRKFGDDVILAVRDRRGAGESIASLAAEYGMSETYVRYVTTGRRRTAA